MTRFCWHCFRQSRRSRHLNRRDAFLLAVRCYRNGGDL